MSKTDKLILKILSGNADNNFPIDELKRLLFILGFLERKGAGSHTLYKKEGLADLINIQNAKGGKAKPYQVRQIREIILKYKLIQDEI
ncbi:MAG: type II toxin-antitoxin system HicA family toxin [Emticicia sp.]|nr:type II toxin-antitoxin system HicA family toxin [Emticicia sp.]